jgi:2-desacetyl-2-hydroxyethyl bacteriochlorophyllide A dehydrogenase
MRERIVVPADKLHPSSKLSLDQLVLVETLGIGTHAVGRAGIESGENVLVIGAGPIGLSVVQFALQAGARVIVSDTNENRLGFCREMHRVETVSGCAVDRVREMTDGDLPTAVFDATGSPRSMEAAFEYVAPGGRLVFVGLVQADITFSDPHFHKREITLLATRNSTANDMRRVLSLMEGGQIDTAPWITHRAGCTEMIERFPVWLLPESRTIKAIVEF